MTDALSNNKGEADLDEIESVIQHLLGISSWFDLATRFAVQEE